MCRSAERGVALVAVVMGIALLTATAVGLATVASLDQRLAAAAVAEAQAEALARSGVAAARAALLDASATSVPDTLAAPWLAGPLTRPIDDGLVSVVIEDEARRLDLGGDPAALARLFARLGVDVQLLDTLEDWIDPDDVPRPHGAEASWYRGERPPRAPANRPLASVGELLLVRGFDVAVLERLRPFLTVAGEDGVNPNTAPPDVLLAQWPDAPRVGEILAMRAKGVADCDTLDGCTTRSGAYTVRASGRVGAVERTVEALVRVLPGADTDVLGWRVLR